jgi:hypothetical protein
LDFLGIGDELGHVGFVEQVSLAEPNSRKATRAHGADSPRRWQAELGRHLLGGHKTGHENLPCA